MEYRFSMTPRLSALAVICLCALMALMFMLGFTLGEKEADSKRPSTISVDETRLMPSSPGAPRPPAKPLDSEGATTTAPAPAPAATKQ
jgi:hypothetical protein